MQNAMNLTDIAAAKAKGEKVQTRGSLLIYAPVPLFRKDGVLYLEGQACNGLRLWAENFPHVNVMMPLEPGPPPADWAPLDKVGPNIERIEIHPFPTAYRPDQFARNFRRVRRQIDALIARSDYLSFAIGGLFGDWGSVACLRAHRLGRKFAVWTDRVESEVTRREAEQGTGHHRLRARLYRAPMAALERHIIRRAELGLFHGRDTFEFYAPYSRNPVLVHDIHIAKSDHIAARQLADKISDAVKGPLKICYVGRADPMKGPLDWIAALEKLDQRGVDFRASWFGEGELLAEMQARIASANLADKITLQGFAKDRQVILDALRDAHLFVFCHKTPESPRCLIEALISGCPIAGYRSAFPQDLIADHAGGVLTPLDDAGALAEALAELDADRTRLATLIANAASDGEKFDDVSVFQHRSEVIKANL